MERVMNGACMDFNFSNAFNKVSRQTFLDECAIHFPQVSPWLNFCYMSPPKLRVIGGAIIEAESGTSQGDPCGPFAFALVHHKLHEVLNALDRQLKFNVWYLDDGKLIGKHADLRRALDYILTEGPALGLNLNLSKCSVWWPTRNEPELS
jgi:Reverse transcriptase (RNA-dependent DNA polymerase)